MKKTIKKCAVFCASISISANIGFAQVEVTSNGDVGIGTPTPAHKLHVVGNNYVTGNSYVGGNFGINTTAPSQRLHVVGNSYFNGNLGIGIAPTSTERLLVSGGALKIGNSSSSADRAVNMIKIGDGSYIQIGEWEADDVLSFKAKRYIFNTGSSDANDITFSRWEGATWDNIIIDWGSAICCGAPTIYPNDNWYLQLGTPTKKLGDIYASNVLSNSFTTLPCDENAKENIARIDNAIEKIKRVSGYRYNVKRDFFAGVPEEALVDLTKSTFGFIAQELEKEFPEMVVKPKSKEETYGVNYMEMIPVLLEAIKEQQTMIETLQKEMKSLQAVNNTLKSGDASTGSTGSLTAGSATTATQDMYLSDNANTETMKLYQNAPNPFNERTVIKCFVPQNIQKAQLCVYNMKGVQVQCLTITERGTVEISIEAGALSSGIYSYVLIGDGAASETKQMILTK